MSCIKWDFEEKPCQSFKITLKKLNVEEDGYKIVFASEDGGRDYTPQIKIPISRDSHLSHEHFDNGGISTQKNSHHLYTMSPGTKVLSPSLSHKAQGDEGEFSIDDSDDIFLSLNTDNI